MTAFLLILAALLLAVFGGSLVLLMEERARVKRHFARRRATLARHIQEGRYR